MKKLASEAAAEIRGWFETAEVKEVLEALEKSAAEHTGTFEVVITTENIDRMNDVIKLDGWELDHYLKNPVVLWGHDHKTLPIGKCTELLVSDGKMVARGRFAPHAHAQEIRALYDLGILRATSVGFIEKEREGNLITKAELIEFSFVNVPANPYALSLAFEKEVSVNELVTKGFMFVEKAEDDEETDPAPEEETPAEPVTEEKTFSHKAVTPIIDSLKAAIIALEALGDEEPEREEAPHGETEEEKEFRQFTELRALFQQVATVTGDTLADMRQKAEEARKEKVGS